LSSLISLEVGWLGETDANAIPPFLSLLSLPELQTIVLHHNYEREGYTTLFQSLV